MSDREIFKNNQIREAICQFTFHESFDNTIYGEYWSELTSEEECEFCKKENIVSFQFSARGTTPPLVPSMVNAMKFTTEGNDKVIQLYQNNLSVHNVRNYKQWEVFKEDIAKASNVLREINPNISVNRIDLRAINEFEFGLDFKWEEHFNVYPTAIGDLPFSTPDKELRLNERLDDKGNFISLEMRKQVTGEEVTMIIDISFTGMFETPSSFSEYTEIEKRMELGHEYLNKVFYNLITEKTKDLIK